MDKRITAFVLRGMVIEPASGMPENIRVFEVPSMRSSDSIREIASRTNTDYTLFCTGSRPVQLGAFALERMVQVADSSSAGMVYADYLIMKEGTMIPNPVIEYQDGSLRDDFDFGSLLLFNTVALKEAAARMQAGYAFAGLYDLRLRISQQKRIVHIPEFLYSRVDADIRTSGEMQFDYVDPKNRTIQLEMEQACTNHLKDINAWLQPVFRPVIFDREEFKTEATVVIPVRNRVKTIADAMDSVLKQKAGFDFNLIVADNHSTDGTTELIRSYAALDRRIIHVIPKRKDLGIGGCWNEAIMHPLCGKFSVQLDSDDLYIDETVIDRIVGAFNSQQCAMVVGSYRMVNFALEEIPPGLIDHKEWTSGNGRNNALRINGLGAPRAFYTPVIRKIRVPNVSYGEDYAVGLAISRYYKIGRIFEPLYLCRRWEENSDASIDIHKQNAFNFYKDKIRTLELWARQQYVQEGQLV